MTSRPRKDTRAIYPLHLMLELDPHGAGLPKELPADADGLDAVAKRLDVTALRAREQANAAALHAEDLRSRASRLRREAVRAQSAAAKIERGEVCGIVWLRRPTITHDGWHLTGISEDAHMIVDAGFGRTFAYSMRRRGLPADRMAQHGQIDVEATIQLWRAFCAARRAS